MEPDLADLLAAWLGLETEPPRREELLARLRRDEAFRRSFVDEIRMLGMLKTVQSPESRWLRLEDELGWSSDEPPPGESLEDRVVRRLDGPPRRRPWPSRTGLREGSIVAAAILLVAALGAMFWTRGSRVGPGTVGDSVATAPRPYPRVDTSTGLAMVVKLDGVRWDPSGGSGPSEGDVLAAGRFRFGSGRAILSMLTGVVLDVEGPADVELISDTKVLCHRGRIRARVPAGAEGFLVLGPSAAVVDLGTEFALNVGLDGKMQGRVFLGKLEAALLDEAGSPRRSFSLDAAKANASKAFEVDSRSGKIAAVAASEDFVAASDPIAPPWPWPPTIPPRSSAPAPGATGGSRPWPTARRRTRSPAAPPCGRPGRSACPPRRRRAATAPPSSGPRRARNSWRWTRPGTRPGGRATRPSSGACRGRSPTPRSSAWSRRRTPTTTSSSWN